MTESRVGSYSRILDRIQWWSTKHLSYVAYCHACMRAVSLDRLGLVWAILKLKGKSLLVAILKLVWSAYLYVIWRQRINMYFGSSFWTEDAVLVQIKEIVRARLGGRPINRTGPVNASLCAWGIIR
ncbi:hypothetical protein PVK06_049262 [Gossypium arboreum]|uniref:Uncharacterized protein n=1 Tax=Gossypium arboreum TaxID=29729 RepID=A0ABR0MI96_GOSAR|nr:hypothetical protein PVK06_049262 [Gossypium arboreum]